MEAAVKFEPEILDKKIVATSSDGKEMVWFLMSREDGHSVWEPRLIHSNGKTEVPVWMPLPGSQNLFLQCPVFEALYEGTRGPGKTLTLIMDFAKEVGKGYGKAWRGVLFRKTFGDLDDVVRKIEDWMPRLYPGFKFLKSKAEYAAVWSSGEQLLLRHMKDETDYPEYHGHEYPWIGWEELTQWDNDKAYKLMMSCCRPTRPGVPRRIRSTTNPYGPGHNWVKKRFQLPHMRGRIIEEPGQATRVAIHGNLSENFITLHDAENYADLISTAATNPAQKAAWLHGSWDVTSGGMIDDLWYNDIHVLDPIPPQRIPKGWTITRAYDHGQSSPFACGWFLESNGEPIDLNGRLVGNVRGDIILWQEWYGTTGEEDTGITLLASKIAAGIRDREIEWNLRGDGWNRVLPGPADTEIFTKRADVASHSPADAMEYEGVYWERADKSAGSRKRGWEMLRTFLGNAVPNADGSREKPSFFVCSNCLWWLELCPPMPRDEKDQDEVPENYEDHMADMTRYRLNWELPGMWRRGF
jgi:hypothetical protein